MPLIGILLGLLLDVSRLRHVVALPVGLTVSLSLSILLLMA
jgi:hypothetical protein